MSNTNYISINFVTEKREGHGEDAPPLLVANNSFCAVGVLDGMGGAGAATCDSAFGEGHTKAYVASRIVRDSVCDILAEHDMFDTKFAEELEELITQRLRKEQEDYPPKAVSMLRSRLVREYPTTLALTILQETDGLLLIDSFWAGDSRNYLWTKEGFYQISADDLEEAVDPMENLRSDAVISNCICADRKFHINHKRIELPKEPVAILSATDGCFGYFQTPMHFEYILKSTLAKSKNEKEWLRLVKKSIQEVTGDDTSLALIGVGFDSFKSFKKMGAKPVTGFKSIQSKGFKLSLIRNQLSRMTGQYEKSLQDGWDVYKQEYMHYITKENDDNA